MEEQAEYKVQDIPIKNRVSQSAVERGVTLPAPYYQEDNITIYHADCFDVLPLLPQQSIQLILTDPPYGTTTCEWDHQVDLSLLWEGLSLVQTANTAIAMTASQPFTTDLINSNRKHFRYELIWNKTFGKEPFATGKRPQKAHENVLLFYESQPIFNAQKRAGLPYKDNRKGQTIKSEHYIKDRVGIDNKGDREPISVLSFPNANFAGMHPTQKPLSLFEYLAQTYSNKQDIILDPFAGSGTTLLAAKQQNRMGIGIEREEKYCEMIVNRLRQGCLLF